MANAARKRRKRRRPTSGPPPQRQARRPAPRQTPVDEQRPPAPWGSFPLNELIIFLALCLLIASFVVNGTRAGPLFAVALILGSLATVEFAVREHFAGYRSHSLLLAAVPAVVVLGLLFYEAPPGLGAPARLAIGGVVFGLGFFLLASVFKRRTGASFKLR
jgi:hypothetical protein